MAGRIPDSFVDELLSRIDIVDIINTRVPLKKAGASYKACCPFHSEKTPSFNVNPVKQFYHCFGCGASGTAIRFLMEYEGRGFRDAIEDLASIAGLSIPESARGPALEHNAPLYDALAAANQYFQQQLRQHPDAAQAHEYLKSRGLSGAIAKRFGLGLAPRDRGSLLQALEARFDTGVLKRAGLVGEADDGRLYDRFGNRIQFPIHDRRGRVIGFGGRNLGDKGPKYLNSPETPVFHKGKELYGLYEAIQIHNQNRQKLESLLVVEGYMDVIALAQHDINHAIATLGTASTEEHLRRIFRSVKHCVFCFDGDTAGRNAAWKALENTLPVIQAGQHAAFLFLPDGEDPDTLVRGQGREAFLQGLGEAIPLSQFLFDKLRSGLDLEQIEDQAALVSRSAPLLQKIGDPILRELIRDELARLSKLSTLAIEQTVAHTPQPRSHAGGQTPGGNRSRPALAKRLPDHKPGPLRKILALLLHQPALALELDREQSQQISEQQLAGSELLNAMLDAVHDNPSINTAALLERFRDHPHGKALPKLLDWQPELPDSELAAEIQDLFKALLLSVQKARLEQLSRVRKPGEEEKAALREHFKTLKRNQD